MYFIKELSLNLSIQQLGSEIRLWQMVRLPNPSTCCQKMLFFPIKITNGESEQLEEKLKKVLLKEWIPSRERSHGTHRSRVRKPEKINIFVDFCANQKLTGSGIRKKIYVIVPSGWFFEALPKKMNEDPLKRDHFKRKLISFQSHQFSGDIRFFGGSKAPKFQLRIYTNIQLS